MTSSRLRKYFWVYFLFLFNDIAFIQLQIISLPLLQHILFKANFENLTVNVLVNSRTWNQNQKFPENPDGFVHFLNGKGWISCFWKQMTRTWILSPGFRGLTTFSMQIFSSFLCHQFIILFSLLLSSPLPIYVVKTQNQQCPKISKLPGADQFLWSQAEPMEWAPCWFQDLCRAEINSGLLFGIHTFLIRHWLLLVPSVTIWPLSWNTNFGGCWGQGSDSLPGIIWLHQSATPRSLRGKTPKSSQIFCDSFRAWNVSFHKIYLPCTILRHVLRTIIRD